ncbi:MAG: type II secretion system protein, partial [Mycobacterium sp.]|nr:type II secretion system protein [Mycobacterium sp.]
MNEMLQKRMASRGQGGFTLIELLVVIAILAVLAGVVVFAVGGITDNSEDSACAIERRT